MVQAIRKRVRVQAGGVISVQDVSLPEGAEAEVIVLLDEAVETEAPDELPALANIIGSGKGGFASAEEIDAYIRKLRDEWD